MAEKYLGTDFDIHGGGADLQFPHHENEIAQSCCAQPNSHFARVWIHNGFLTVNGEKMSKSLKNFITVFDLLEKKIPGIIIRFMLLSSHYRKPFDYNDKVLEDSKKSLEKFYSVISLEDFLSSEAVPDQIISALSDDLNFSKAIAFLHDLAKKIKLENDKNLKSQMAKSLDFLGFFDPEFFAKNPELDIDEAYIEAQIAKRSEFKIQKNYAGADAVRKELLEKGIVLEDVAGGKTIFKRV